MKKPYPSAIFALVWAAACVGGLGALWAYKLTPARPDAAPRSWPREAPRRGNGPALVLLAHPRCDCTRASLDELSWILSRVPEPRSALVVLVRRGEARSAEDEAARRRAAAVPGVSVLVDPEGGLARRFGGGVSGRVLVYAADGRLAFDGGITSARGHRGASAGREAALAALTGRPGAEAAPVFGCAL
jgi:hypothetical protein